MKNKKTITWFYANYTDEKYNRVVIIKRLNEKGLVEFKRFNHDELLKLSKKEYGFHNPTIRLLMFDFFMRYGIEIFEKDISSLELHWVGFNVDVK